MKLKSEKVDAVICQLEDAMIRKGKHLMKTSTIMMKVSMYIDLEDDSQEREELLDIGIKQVIQSRLYAHGYFSIGGGYFVNVATCQNIAYLQRVIDNKDNVIDQKKAARDRINELKSLNGQQVYEVDEDGNLIQVESKTREEVIGDLEADSI